MAINWKNIPDVSKISKVLSYSAVFCLVLFLAVAFYIGDMETVIDALSGSAYIDSAAHCREVQDAFDALGNYLAEEDVVGNCRAEEDAGVKQWEESVSLSDRDVYYDTSAVEKGWDFEYCLRCRRTYGHRNHSVMITSTQSLDHRRPTGLDMNYWYLYKEDHFVLSTDANQEVSAKTTEVSLHGMDAIAVAFEENVMFQKKENWSRFCSFFQILAVTALALLLASFLLLLVKILAAPVPETEKTLSGSRKANPKAAYDLLLLLLAFLFLAVLLLYRNFREPLYRLVCHGELWGEAAACIVAETVSIFCGILIIRRMLTHGGYSYLASNTVVRSGFRSFLALAGMVLTGQKVLPERFRRGRKLYFALLSLCNILLGITSIYLFCTGSGAAVAVFGIFCVFLLLYHANTLWQLYQYRLLEEQIIRIYEGDYQKQTEWKSDLCFREDMQMLQEIGEGFEQTLRDKIVSERTKVELVTNVSHDLKTPLTSIIGYVDLLSREDGLNEQSQMYVRILGQKANRLKAIVADVYELAKTASGEIEVKKERLNFNKLIIQSVAEMEETIQEAALQAKLQLTSEDVMIESDGGRLYRVLQNLIDNAVKYSLAGTRIYFQESVEGGKVFLKVISTARYEMDFTEQEVAERFFRGDKSRNSEGSGLGLSIAEGFTLACGGSFEIKIEGDQFKVILAFPLLL